MDLRPSRHPRLDHVPELVARDVAAELVDEHRTLGPGPDQAHVTGKDVEELRQLVDAGAAQQRTERRRAGVPGLGEAWTVLFRAVPHGAELEQPERLANEGGGHLPGQDLSW